MGKISRDLASPATQSAQNDAESSCSHAHTQLLRNAQYNDSGNDLFITQNPVPKAARRRKRHHCSRRSDHASANDREGCRSDSSASGDRRKRKSDKDMRWPSHRLPKFTFPFLTGRNAPRLPGRRRKLRNITMKQTVRLHNYAMGGFFKCVKELWENHQAGDNPESSLPTVDGETEIPPLSEEEEEWSDDEDIKVVENKQFLVAYERERWNAPKMSDQEEKLQLWTDAQRGRRKNPKRMPAAPASTTTGGRFSDAASTAAVVSCPTVPAETEESSECVKNQRIVGDQSETQMEKTWQRTTSAEDATRRGGHLSHQSRLCCNRDATFSAFELQRSPDEDASSIVTEPEAGVDHKDSLSPTGRAKTKTLNSPDLISDLNSERIRDGTVAKKKKKKGFGEDGTKLPDVPDAGRFADVAEEDRAEPPALQTDDELQFNENDWKREPWSCDDNILRQEEEDVAQRDVPRLKAKKRENRSLGQNVRPEHEDGGSDRVTRAEESSADGKRKKKGKRDDEEEQLPSRKDPKPLNDDAAIKKKKKKKKRKVPFEAAEDGDDVTQTLTFDPLQTSAGRLDEAERCSESAALSEETSERGSVKRKKQRPSPEDDAVVGEEGENVEAKAAQSVNKKKRKKKRHVFSMTDGTDETNTPENVENDDKTWKTTEEQGADAGSKTDKTRDISAKNVSEDTFTQSRKSGSRRKRRSSSFRVAEKAEKDASCQSAPVTSAGNPRVSTAEFDTPSAVTEPNDCAKKRTASVGRDSVDGELAEAFEQHDEAPESGSPEAKRERKKRRGEREFVRLESAPVRHSPTNEAVVFKKKRTKCGETPRDTAEGFATRLSAHKEKRKRAFSPSAETFRDGIREEAAEERVAENVPRSPTLRHGVGKKNEKSSGVSTGTSSSSVSETSSSVSSDKRTRCKKAKRTLYCWDQNYLSNC